MSLNNLIITNILFDSFKKINTGYIILDIIYIITLSSIILYLLTPNFKNYFFKSIENIIFKFNYTNRIVFISNEKESSKKYRSIMYYISKSNDPSVKIFNRDC